MSMIPGRVNPPNTPAAKIPSGYVQAFNVPDKYQPQAGEKKPSKKMPKSLNPHPAKSKRGRS